MRQPDPIRRWFGDFQPHQDVAPLTPEAYQAQSYIWRDLQSGHKRLSCAVREECRYLGTVRLKPTWRERIVGWTRRVMDTAKAS